MGSQKGKGNEVNEARMRIGILVLVLLICAGLNGGSLSSSSQHGITRAISSIEEALDAVEEIQVAEDLEEARELAIKAEEDLRKAVSILEGIEIPNWLWLPQQGALYWHGPILDKETEEPVEAKVFINGRFVDQAKEIQLLMWATEESPVWVEVRAEGYQPWGLRWRFHLRGLEVIQGPIWLVKEG